MKKIGISLLFYFTSIVAYGQQEVKGTLIFGDNTPISFAEILILDGENLIQESSSNEEGYFSTTLNDGKYTIRIEQYGILLHTQEVSVNGGNLGIILVPISDNITLTETIVTGQKKLIEKKVDRLIFNPDQAEGAKGGNALDALKLAPRIKIDENTDAVSIVGKGAVSILINDRLMQMEPAQLSNYLKTIRTEDIDKIEIITSPPAKFDASGNSGVINIVLKNSKQDSFNGSLSTALSHANYTGVNYNGNLNYRKGKWTLSARGFTGDNESGQGNTNTVLYTANRWESERYNHSKNKYLGAGLGIDYNISETLITGFNLDYSIGEGQNLSQATDYIYDLPSNDLNRYLTTDHSGTQWDWRYVGFNYHVIKKFNTEGKKLTFDFDYSNNNSDADNLATSNEFYPNHLPIENKFQSNLTENNYQSDRFNFSLDMEHPINSWKMNYGTRIRIGKDETKNKRFTKTDADFIEEDEYKYHFKYDENIYAFFYDVEKQISEKWSAKAGLRYEHAKIKAFSDKENISYTKTYNDLFPTAYIMYQATENHSFSVNYSRRINRPTMWHLNPLLIKLNDYYYQTGNPDVLPSYSNNFEFEHAYKDMFVSSIYMSLTNDIVGQISEHNPSNQVMIAKPFNFAKSTSIGFSETVNIKPIKWWKINLTADIYYIKTVGQIPSMKYTLDGINGDFSFTNNFELNKAKTLFANYNYSYSSKGTDSDLDTYNDYLQHNAGIRAMLFNKKLQLSFNVNNIFENHRPTYTSRTNDVYSSWTNESVRTFRFSIAYNFGKQFNIEKSKSNQEQSAAGGN
ncbi:MAG: TonB-dependent receptor family protein [Weeksellaceae bacterium]|nr:TonB-dependent receptor family protein [Weeksellaceae bacterium]